MIKEAKSAESTSFTISNPVDAHHVKKLAKVEFNNELTISESLCLPNYLLIDDMVIKNILSGTIPQQQYRLIAFDKNSNSWAVLSMDELIINADVLHNCCFYKYDQFIESHLLTQRLNMIKIKYSVDEKLTEPVYLYCDNSKAIYGNMRFKADNIIK